MAEITKNLGTFQFAANFQVKAAEALDPRMVASSKADLINKANWPSDGDTIYVYNGLIVDCGSDGVYRLIDASKALATDYSGWERIDAKSLEDKLTNIYTYKGTVATFAALPENPNVGDVYNVEAEHTVTTEGGLTKEYLAGTNWAWNGTEWDALAGALDMSDYALKSEFANYVPNTTYDEFARQYSTFKQNITRSNAEVSEEGQYLITGAEVKLIANHETRLGTLEGIDAGGRLDALEDIDAETRLTALEGIDADSRLDLLEKAIGIGEGTEGEDNPSLEVRVAQNETAIETITETTIPGIENRIGAIDGKNGSIAAINTKLNSITNDSNAGRLDAVESIVDSIIIRDIDSSDKILSTDNYGTISSTIGIKYNDQNKKIELTGVGDQVVSSFDASVFIKDGMIDTVSYDPNTQDLTITWNTDGGKTQSTVIDLTHLIDVYTAGNGLTLTGNKFEVKAASGSGYLDNKLTVSEAGLFVDITGDLEALSGELEETMDSKIESAFTWEEVE